MKKIYLTVAVVVFSIHCAICFPGNPDERDGMGQYPFIQNKGQVYDQFHQPRKDVLYTGSNAHMVFHLRDKGVSYQYISETSVTKVERNIDLDRKIPANINSQLSIYRIDVDWLNCNPAASVKTVDPSPDHINYYNVVCPQGVRVNGVKEVLYEDLYPGIDLRWYTSDGNLKYDYIVAPGASYKQIELLFKGQQRLSISKNGDLIISTPFGELIEGAPSVYQEGRQLRSAWVIKNDRAAFFIAGADPSKALLIDPIVRVWGTYYGGIGREYVGKGCADAQGNVYITGQTSTPTNLNIATTGAHQVTYGGGPGGNSPGDAFLAKYNASGVRQWSTYYGGSGSDYATGVVTDAGLNVYIVGASNSSSAGVIATSGAYQGALAGGVQVGDAMIVKFDASGARIWGTYYGDSHDDWANNVAIDPGGNNIYVTGGTIDGTGTALATSGAHQTAHGTGTLNFDCFLAKFTTSGARVWSTYYGGTGEELGNGCATDASGNVFLSGITTTTLSGVIATSGAHQTGYAGNTGPFNNGDAFLVKFDASGVRLWGTYYGGTSDDYSSSCAVDANGDVYMGGNTASSNPNAIATPGSPQTTFGGAYDAYLVKFSSSGTRVWGTYCGINTVEDWTGCTTDGIGNVYLYGQGTSTSNSVLATPCSYQPTGGGQIEAFIIKYGGTGQKLWSTYYGGNGIEENNSVFCSGQAIYLAGSSSGSGTVITTPGSQQPNAIGINNEAYLVKFDPCMPSVPTVSVHNSVCKNKTVTMSNTSPCQLIWYSDQTGSFVLNTGLSYTSGPLQSDTTFYLSDMSCGIPGVITPINVTLAPSPTITIYSDRPVICVGESTSLEAFGGVSYSWTAPPQTGSVLTVVPGTTTIFQVTGEDATGCTSQKSYTIQVYNCPGIKENQPALFTVFPQPATDLISIRSDSPAQLMLHSMSGQIITEIELSPKNDNQAEISGLPTGVYLLSTKDKTFVKKVVVIK